MSSRGKETKEALDRRPGPPPEIRASGNSVSFAFAIGSVKAGAQLVLRCDNDGNVWMSIQGAERAS